MLSAKQRKYIELMVSGEKSPEEIALELKISEKTLLGWKKNNEEFMQLYCEAINTALQFASGAAIKTQINLMESDKPMVAYLAAKDILDRSGFKASDKVELEATLIPKVIDDIPKKLNG